ncbi:MAG: threonine--tRNA ligase, partial [Ruminococcus sp.]|nr:threonine--tRNA ligase [Ruminococcus sp.]
SIGCYERTLALLIEKYAGAFPMWLAPTQIKLLAVADRHLDYVYDIKKKLDAEGFRVEVDSRSEKIGYKIREAQLEKVPYMFIVGDKDIEAGTVSVRHRKDGDLGAMQLEDFIQLAHEEIDTKAIK